MLPQINIMGTPISSYALMAVIGMLLCSFLFCTMIARQGLNDNDAILFIFYVLAGVMLGSHLLYAFVNINRLPALFTSKSIKEFLMAFISLFGGSVFYGGLIGGLCAGLMTVRLKKLPRAIYADCMAPIIPLFHGIARIGCFLAGCCYGVPSPLGFTAQGNDYAPALNGISRFPVQLLESGCNLILALILGIFLKKGRFKGQLLLLYLCCYSCIRFFDEFLRGDQARGFVGILSTSQFISLLILAACGITLALSKNRNRNS